MRTRERVRIAFIVTELSVGGAELMLWKLLSRLDRERFESRVFGLSSRADHTVAMFDEIGVPCELIGVEPTAAAPAGLLRLARRLHDMQPHVVQGWLYHGNLAATLGSSVARCGAAVLWNIRGEPIPDAKRSSRAVAWLGAKLGRVPAKIIYNSRASASAHERLGYPESKRLILPNGFDTEVFRPDPAARAEIRRELDVPADTRLVGLIGRYHPVKDHETFLRAAALVRSEARRVDFVLAGKDVDAKNATLRTLIGELGLQERVHLLGLRQDMPRLTAALDLSVLSSTVEGFPNVVGEAMSCEVPCAVTDVGDSAWIVGDTGRNVPPRDPAALASAVSELLALGDDALAELGRRARQRIIDEFSLPSVVRRYEALYEQVHSDARAPQA